MLRSFKEKLHRVFHKLNPTRTRRDLDTLYHLLYQFSHDMENAVDIFSSQTTDAFEHQWTKFSKGRYLLSDPWFRQNVDRIIVEEELQLKREWFKGKDILDAGCGNGRWSYGFAKLGANVTAVDINQIAIEETRKAIRDFTVKKAFYVSPLEELSKNIPSQKHDLVFCWGVLNQFV